MNAVSEVILCLVDDLPAEHVTHLVRLLQGEPDLNWNRLGHVLRSAIPHLEVQERVQRFVSQWGALLQPPTPSEMALLLQLASDALAYQRSKQKLELVWTGPQSPSVSLRRTDQALLELIHAARERILVVSFAVYKARSILAALERAADRGAEITIILESPDTKEGQHAYSTLRALGTALREKSKVFLWPEAKRLRTPGGKIGSLHAKLAVADGAYAYLSSANLTDYAMTVNMEMGLLLRNPAVALQIERHFRDLITQQVLMEVERLE